MTGNRLRLLPSALGLGKADILSSESALAPFSSFRKSFLKVFFLLNFELWFGPSEARLEPNEKFRRKKTFKKLFQAPSSESVYRTAPRSG